MLTFPHIHFSSTCAMFSAEVKQKDLDDRVPWAIYHWTVIFEGCTNSRHQVAQATKFCTSPNICGSIVWNLLQNLNPAGTPFNIGGTRNQNMRDAKYFENTWKNTVFIIMETGNALWRKDLCCKSYYMPKSKYKAKTRAYWIKADIIRLTAKDRQFL